MAGFDMKYVRKTGAKFENVRDGGRNGVDIRRNMHEQPTERPFSASESSIRSRGL